MIRHCFALAAGCAILAAAVPASAHDGPPPPPPAPGWGDPQTPGYPDGRPMPDGRDGPGAPFARPLPPGAYPGGPPPYPAGPEAYPERYHEHGPDGGPPGAWRGPGPGYGYEGYAYRYQAGPAPCGCGAYPLPPLMWVPVPIETRYRYSPPIRHEREIVSEHVVREEVVERLPVHRETKYVKTVRPIKYTKAKVVRTTK